MLLATMEGTGSQFFCELFRKHKIEFDFVHLYDDVMPDLIRRAQSGELIVTTLRQWHKTLDTANEYSYRYPILKQLENWCRLLAYDPIVVSVDCQCDERLARLSKAVGTELRTDWRPVNARKDTWPIHPLEYEYGQCLRRGDEVGRLDVLRRLYGI